MQSGKKGFLVVGINPRVGTTLVAAALASICREANYQTGVHCPFELGVEAGQTLGPAGRLLRRVAQSELPDEQITPYRFKSRLDPAVAATREKVKIDFNSLIKTAENIIEKNDFTIIDGGPGLMVPIVGGLLLADYAARLNLPLIFVCSPCDGVVNHTLLSLFAAKQMDLSAAGYIINKMPVLKTSAEEALPHTLAVMTAEELLFVLNEVEGTDEEKAKQLGKTMAAMPTFGFLNPFLPAKNGSK